MHFYYDENLTVWVSFIHPKSYMLLTFADIASFVLSFMAIFMSRG